MVNLLEAGNGLFTLIDNIDRICTAILGILFLINVSPLITFFRTCKNMPPELKKGVRYYIDSYGQWNDPCNQEEMINNEGMKFNLLDYFMDEFRNKNNRQYYILLADSGMGKSTFMAKLYRRTFWRIFKYNVRYFDCAFFDQEKENIRKIKRKNKTILLLDGFDENTYAKINYAEKLIDVEEFTKNFYKIIITARTQMFINEKEEPQQLSVTGRRENSVKYSRVYMSPFSEHDIDTYLQKKYKRDQEKRRKAKKLIMKCPKLMVRPLLLSYIDSLIPAVEEKDISKITLYEIYQFLLDSWIKYEKTMGLSEHLSEMAEYMYTNRKTSISVEEMNTFSERLSYNKKEIREAYARTRILHNRNSLGMYKFAHKSILEFLISKNILSSAEKYIFMDVNEFDMCKIFVFDYVTKTNNIVIHPIVLLSHAVTEEGGSIEKLLQANKDNFKKGVFINCNFDNMDLSEADFTGAKFYNVTFSGSNLNHADMADSELYFTKFADSKADNLSLKNINIHQAEFKGIDLTDVVWGKTDLSNADIVCAKVRMYEIWDHITQKLKAFEFFSKDCYKDNPTAQKMIGCAYELKIVKCNNQGKDNYPCAERHMKLAAAKNEMESILWLGRNAKDSQSAEYWHMRAAGLPELQDAENIYKMAKELYWNSEEAVYWKREAANGGSVEAQYSLGEIYQHENEEESMKWYTKAADNGSIKAQRRIADHYYETESDKAYYWYERAADNGDKESLLYAGQRYFYGYGIQIDKKKGTALWRKYIELAKGAKSSYSTYIYENAYLMDTVIELAVAYYYGEGVEQSWAKGIELLQPVKDNNKAKYWIGAGYCEREDGERDIKRGLDLIQEIYLNKSGNMEDYALGKGEDSVEEEKLDSESIIVGCMGSMEALARLATAYSSGKRIGKDKLRAIYYWTVRACDETLYLNHPSGKIYTYIFEQDRKMGINYFLKAAERGDLYSQQALSLLSQ